MVTEAAEEEEAAEEMENGEAEIDQEEAVATEVVRGVDVVNVVVAEKDHKLAKPRNRKTCEN